MSRLNKMLLRLLEPATTGRNVFLVNKSQVVVLITDAGEIRYGIVSEHGWQSIVKMNNTELVQIVAGFSEIA